MTKENLVLLENVYEDYLNIVKPRLAQIEALYEKFPIQLYNEVRAMNDHVARAIHATDNEESKAQIKKAHDHCHRIILDCYKYLNLFYKEESEQFQKKILKMRLNSKTDFDLEDRFWTLLDDATDAVEYARAQEKAVDRKTAYLNYEESYNKYHILHMFIKTNRIYVSKSIRSRQWSTIGGILFSLLTFILGCVLTNYNLQILGFIKNIFQNF